MNKEIKIALIILLSIIVMAVAISLKPWYTVQPGETAIHMRFGNPRQVATTPGIRWKIPLIDNVVIINNRICRINIETRSLSKDLQTVDIGAVLNYRIQNGFEIFKTVGPDFASVIINPFVQESLKAVVVW